MVDHNHLLSSWNKQTFPFERNGGSFINQTVRF